MNKILFVLIFHWVCYCFFHSLLADSRVKTFLTRFLKIKLATYRIIYNIIALLWLIGILYFHYTVESIFLFQESVYIYIVGWAGVLAGGGIMIACIKKYFNQLSGLKDQDQTEKLQIKGLHQWVRHPLYFGTFLFLIGLFLLYPQLKNLLAVVIIISYTLAGTLLEEKKLILQFGEDYIQYQKSVPMIWPRIKIW